MIAALADGACGVVLVTLVAGRVRRHLRDRAIRRRIMRRRAVHRRPVTHMLAVVTRRRRRPSPVSATNLAGLLDDIARRCGSGDSMATAFVDALKTSSVATAFEVAIIALSRGATIDESLAAVAATSADQRLAIHVLQLCAAQGGAVTESLDRAAATLREREAMAAERRAQAAQARLSAHVLTLVPLGFAVWTLATSPTVARFLATQIGLGCVGVGVALNIVGWRLMNRAIGART